MRKADRLVRDVKSDSLFWGLNYWMKVVTRAVGVWREKEWGETV